MDRKCEAEAMAMVEELVLKGNKTESAPLSVEEDKGDDGVQLSHMKEKVQSFVLLFSAIMYSHLCTSRFVMV